MADAIVTISIQVASMAARSRRGVKDFESLSRTYAHKVAFYESRTREFVVRYGLSSLTKSFKADVIAFSEYLRTCGRRVRRSKSDLLAKAWWSYVPELESRMIELNARWDCMQPFLTGAPACIFLPGP